MTPGRRMRWPFGTGGSSFVGSSADVRPLIRPRTRVIELDGETLLPGFQDAHIHPIEGGMLSRSCDLHDLADAAAYLDAIAAYATAHPDRAWITGSGWSLPAFPRGEPRPLAARRHCPRPPGPAGQRRRPRGLGQLEGPRRWRDRPRDARSAGWPDRPRRRAANRPARCTTTRSTLSRAMHHRRRTTICSRGCARPSATSTRWGSPAGRTPTSSPMRWPPIATRPRPAGSPRASSRPCGGGARPGSSRSTPSRRSATHRPSDGCARTA